MSRTSKRTSGAVVRELLSVADLLEEPRLAHLYSYLVREGESTVQELMDALDLAQGTAYTDVNQLVDAGVIEVKRTDQPRTYVACEIDLTLSAVDGDREYTITPALVDAVARRTTDEDIDTYIDRHGISGLAIALSYALARERGEVTHRQMAADLDVSPLAAEIVIQALRPVVHEHFDVEATGASVADIVGTADQHVDDET